MRNLALARIFSEIADMLEIKEESIFRISAYRRGARGVGALTEDVAEVAARDDLEEIPGIGASTAEKIEEYLKTGTITYYEELRAALPAGITTLMSVPEVGPKTALLLYEKLGVTTIDELEKASRQGLVRKLPLIVSQTKENILKGIELIRRTKERLPLGQVLPHANELDHALRALKEVKAISL